MTRTSPRPAPHVRLAPTVAVAVCALLALVLLGVLGSALPAASGPVPVRASESYGLPLAGAPDVARRFEAPEQAWSAGHRGVDLRSVVGAEVLAPADGVVAFAGSVAGRGVLTVAHPDGRRSSLEPVGASVLVGTRVARGDPVGTVEAAGSHCAPRTCLHWGVREGAEYVDPLGLLPGAGPVVLLSSGTRPAGGQTRSASMRRVRSRTIAAVCICEIRDSVTPRTRPISARVMPS